ncbi:ABC transporter ATP-binding protein [Polaromonas jejuensis]|uniref:ABC transporter ATP-binding protein n=1 Tax=Polaromonas jejuensis TaxID=457502 RepID=A0ABW0Q5D6_9BURK|nr:ABC transporter ATP-binding protein [Polaromonas jejuensis]
MSVELQGVTVRYGPRAALQDVHLCVQAGRVLGIVGANGSGKSSLVKAVAGLVPSEGRIRVCGHAAGRCKIGYMPQDLQAPMALTVLEVVLLGRLGQLRLRVQPDDLDAVRQVLQRLGLEVLAGRYLNELSGGQRQMAFLAQALVSEPAVLLLDEPISALDICHQLEVLEVVRAMTIERQLCTLIVLHDLNATARFADDVALLRDGRLLAWGAPEQVLTVDNVAAGFDTRAEVLACDDGTRVLVSRQSLRGWVKR